MTRLKATLITVAATTLLLCMLSACAAQAPATQQDKHRAVHEYYLKHQINHS